MGKETGPVPHHQDIVDYVARARLGGILPSDLDPSDGATLSYYYGLLAENRDFRRAVMNRMRRFQDHAGDGVPAAHTSETGQYPLYSEENPTPERASDEPPRRQHARPLADWLSVFHRKHDIPGTELTHDPIGEGRRKGLSIRRLLEGDGSDRRFPCGCSVHVDREGIITWSRCGHDADGDCMASSFFGD